MPNSKSILARHKYPIALAVLLLSSVTSARDENQYMDLFCAAERREDGRSYDLTSLTSTSIDNEWRAKDPESGSTFAINVCHQVLSETWGVSSPESIGIYKEGPPSNTHSGESLGQFNTTLRVQEQGVSLVYTGGSQCPGGRLQKSSIIYFPCMPKAGLGQPRFIGSLDECSYFFEWQTSASCLRESGVTSLGSIFNMIFWFLLLAPGLAGFFYIIIGTLYRKFVDKRTGLDLVPPNPLPSSGVGGNIRQAFEFARDITVIGLVSLYDGLRNAYGRLTGKRRAGGFVGLPSDAEEARTLFGDNDEDER